MCAHYGLSGNAPSRAGVEYAAIEAEHQEREERRTRSECDGDLERSPFADGAGDGKDEPDAVPVTDGASVVMLADLDGTVQNLLSRVPGCVSR